MNLYQPHVQKLYDYCITRIKQDLDQINQERKAEEEQPFVLSEEEIQEAAQNLLNYITDTEMFQEEVSDILMVKIRRES